MRCAWNSFFLLLTCKLTFLFCVLIARDKKGTEKKTYTWRTKKQRIMEKGSRKNFIWKRERERERERERWFSYNQNVYMQKYT